MEVENGLIRVLLMEDNPEDAQLLRRMLSHIHSPRFMLTHVRRLADGIRELAQESYDVVLLDLGLPDSSSIGTLIRAHAHAPRLPIVVLTGDHDEALGIETLRAGAQDYLVKGHVDGDLLVRSIRYAIERKGTEESLRKTNELLERVFSNIHLLVAYLDGDFNFIRVNEAYARADGRDPAFFVGKNHFALYPNAENEAIFQQAVATGQPIVVYEKPFEYPDHPQRGTMYFDWSVQPVKGEDGNVSGVILSILDVTERVRARQVIEAERRRLFTVLNILPGFVLLGARDYSIRYANHKFREYFGEFRGQPCYKIMQKRDAPCEVCPAHRVFETRQAQEWEWTCPAGQTYQVMAYPFSDADGSQLVLQLGIDITHRRRLEKEVLDIIALEQQRIGQDLHDVVGQHLTGVAFLSKVLEEALTAKSIPEGAEAAKITRLVNQTISQTRSLAKGLCPAGLGSDGLVTGIQELVSNAEDLFGISCHFDWDPSLAVQDPNVATHLYHIVQEAVHNAVKHGRAREVRVSMKSADDSRIALTVEDDGEGLPGDVDTRKGMGLRIMAYRASMIGGLLDVRPAGAGGTVVICTFRKSPPR